MGNACLILVNHHFCCLNHHFGHDFLVPQKMDDQYQYHAPNDVARRPQRCSHWLVKGYQFISLSQITNISPEQIMLQPFFSCFFTDGSPSNTFPLSLAGLWILSRTNFAKPSWMPSTSLPIGRNFWRTSVCRSVGSVELETHATGWTETGFDGEPGTQLGIKHPRKQW